MTRKSKPRLLLTAAALIALVFTIPAGGSGAYWTAQEAGDAGATATGTWCAVPDPETNKRAIRLADIPQVEGAEGGSNKIRMVIIPVANNAAWGGVSEATKRLGVRLHSCQDNLDTWDSSPIRISAWSNRKNLELNELEGTTPQIVRPTSRLQPTSAYGKELQQLARWGQDNNNPGSTVNPPNVRRFSWILSSGRYAGARDAYPGCPTIGSCSPSFLDKSKPEGKNPKISTSFKPNDWTQFPDVKYLANTYAIAGSGGWANKSSNKTVKSTTLEPTSDPDVVNSTNGNLMQWVVIEWWGTTPSSDMIAEIVLE